MVAVAGSLTSAALDPCSAAAQAPCPSRQLLRGLLHEPVPLLRDGRHLVTQCSQLVFERLVLLLEHHRLLDQVVTVILLQAAQAQRMMIR